MSKLLDLLREVERGDGVGDHVTSWYRNPEGPAAANLIEALQDALLIALPYVECAADDGTFKPGRVRADAAKLRAALDKAESGL